MITNHQADILRHASDNGRYVTNDPIVLELGRNGLLRDHGPQVLAGGGHYLTVTPSGRAALNEWQAAQPKPKQPKRRKSEQFEAWERFCDAFKRISFPDFLKEVWPHRNEYR